MQPLGLRPHAVRPAGLPPAGHICAALRCGARQRARLLLEPAPGRVELANVLGYEGARRQASLAHAEHTLALGVQPEVLDDAGSAALAGPAG